MALPYHPRMAVYLDDQAVELTGGSLVEVLRAAQQRIAPDGRVLVEVRLDGESLTGDKLAQSSESDVTAVEVRLYSADPKVIAADALDQVRRKLAVVRQGQQEAAELFQQDRGLEALRTLAAWIDAWLQVQQAVTEAASLVSIDLAEFDVDGTPGSKLMEQLIGGLRELKDGIIRQDTVALSDALLYEWPAIVDQWDRLIERLVDTIDPIA